jgi:predicted esterase
MRGSLRLAWIGSHWDYDGLQEGTKEPTVGLEKERHFVGTMDGTGCYCICVKHRSSGPMMARLLATIVLLAISLACAGVAPTGLREDVIFTAYSPLAGNAERMRRLLSPLTARRIQRQLQKAHERLSEQAIDLAQERFTLYVPKHPPPAGGYALLVFVSPWEDAREARQWVSVLDRTGTIFVSAQRSGNDMDVLNRREPLALLAAYNVLQRYHVDPKRVYVGGFSGGSKVALRLALGYPDVFRGVLLEAGSEPIGTPAIPLPPADLLHRFQDSVRVVYLTGDRDDYHQREDAGNRDSLRRWCVTSLSSVRAPWLGHELADAGSFSRALSKLSEPAHPDADKLTKCRAANEQSLQSQLGQARAQMGAGNRDAARKVLEQVDTRYGGLAAPQVVALMERLEAGH